ncbi:hypothetical protein PVT01_000086500 [Plasmodium vivax]|uniref:VIR protein n=1 Tax=Plasmodium vivax TaxID=5855 RepID=A0A1G4ECM7_PLAVI|nr:hypothetical protein PVT01_000086500 [Plasmodium vivax]
MSGRFSPTYRKAKGIFQQLNDARCISSFTDFKTQIEKQISALGKKKPSDFCKQCVNIKETIIKKDREFKGCLTDRSKQLKLIDVNGEIKDFTDECISVYSQCFQKRLSRDRKLVESKRISEKSCETNGSCKQKMSTVPQKNKSSPRLAPEPRSTESSQQQILQNPRGELENGEKLRQQGVILEEQKDVQCAVISVDQDSDGKTQIGNIPDKDIPGSQVHSDQAVAMKNAEGSPIAQIDLVSEERGDQNPISSSTVIPYTEKITGHHVDTVPVGIIDPSSDHLTTSDVPSSGRSAEGNFSHPEGSDQYSTGSELSAGVINNDAHTRSEDDLNISDDTEDVGQETSCIKNADGTLGNS